MAIAAIATATGRHISSRAAATCTGCRTASYHKPLASRPSATLDLPEPRLGHALNCPDKRSDMADTVMLTGHEEIRDWAAARMEAPAIVDVSAKSGTQPMLRLVFDQQAYQDTDQAERPQNAAARGSSNGTNGSRSSTSANWRSSSLPKPPAEWTAFTKSCGDSNRLNRWPMQARISCSTRGCRRSGRRSPRPRPWPARPGGCGP